MRYSTHNVQELMGRVEEIRLAARRAHTVDELSARVEELADCLESLLLMLPNLWFHATGGRPTEGDEGYRGPTMD
jgi:hypothetical protein